jgi:hypothetical protein
MIRSPPPQILGVSISRGPFRPPPVSMITAIPRIPPASCVLRLVSLAAVLAARFCQKPTKVTRAKENLRCADLDWGAQARRGVMGASAAANKYSPQATPLQRVRHAHSNIGSCIPRSRQGYRTGNKPVEAWGITSLSKSQVSVMATTNP